MIIYGIFRIYDKFWEYLFQTKQLNIINYLFLMEDNVTVIGFGAMGSGISEYFALHGFEVKVYETSAEIYKRNVGAVKNSIDKLYEKKISSYTSDEVLRHILPSTTIEGSIRDSGLVIEAVNENAILKSNIIKKISNIVDDDVIITSNTSSIPISYIQRGANKPERIAGLHWFNPPVLMKLIEIVKGSQTDDEVISKLSSIVKKIEKEHIIAMKDVRRFIANRVLRALRYHAFILYHDGKYSAEQIDSTLIYNFGLPMGIFALTDFTGGIKIEQDESKTYDEMKLEYPEYEPSVGYDLLYKKFLQGTSNFVKENSLGVQSGKGFYTYPSAGKWSKPEISRDAGKNIDPLELLAPIYNHSIYMVKNHICTREDIDKAVKSGFNWPIGLFEFFDKKVDKNDIVKVLDNLSKEYPELADFYFYQGS